MKNLIFILISLVVASCNKETQNTPSFSLKINGVPWSASPSDVFFGGTLAFYLDEKGLLIQATSSSSNKDKDDKLFSISCKELLEPGKFNLDDDTTYGDHLDNCKTWWVIDTTDNSSYLKINEIDYKTNFVTGEFQFKLINPSCTSDIINITEGKFNSKKN